MKEELYINGQSVDLGESVDITLNYKSNMITDLSKIVGNNSYTIKLPKTRRNIGIIGVSDIPSVVTSFPRVSHPCRYFRNGIEIVPDGRAVLLAVSDYIEIVMTWGSTAAFFKMVEDGRNLDEFAEVDDFIMWNATNSKDVYNGTSEVLNADMTIGLRGGEKLAAIHPSVRSTYIFNLIEDKYGLSFEFPDDRKLFIESLIIPLLTRNSGFANIHRTTGNVIQNEFTDQPMIVKTGEEFDKNFEWLGELDGSYFEGVAAPRDVYGIKALVSGTVTISPSFRSSESDKGVYHGTTYVSENFEYFPYTLYENDNVISEMYDYYTPVEIQVMEGDVFAVNLFRAVPESSLGVYFDIKMKKSEIQIGDRFPIVENLPSIKTVDFIKAVCSLSGLFAVPSSDGSLLRFVSFDELADKSSAVEWSDKIIPKDRNNAPRGIAYSLDDFARNNRMKWKDDNTVDASFAEGNIVVDDMTLEFERDAVQLPFAATNTRGGMAFIRLYEYNDNGEPELQDVEPRLLMEKNIKGYSTATFIELEWERLLGKYYQTYQNAVKSPKIITETVRLNEFDLKGLDASKPVYLRQYGKYYAVVDIKAPSTGICECKLLQLED